MTEADRQSLREIAEEWVTENADSIVVYEKYVPSEAIPEGCDESWIETGGGESDAAVGFTIIPVSVDDGPSGWALITVRGHSWEGLRIFIEGIFPSEEDGRDAVARWGVIC